MAAEENRMAHFRRLVEENSPRRKDGSPDLKLGYQAVADLAGLKYDYVYQLYNGKSGKKSIGPAALKKISEAFGEGRPADWMDQAPHEEHAEASFEHLRPPTVEEAVHVLAEALANMDPIGRGMAESALASLAKDPGHADMALDVLKALMRSHTQPVGPDPTPPPSTGKVRDRQRATERQPGGKAHLVLKIGGGEKRQLALPLKTVRNPFDPSAAPARERAWYDQLKVAPKASDDD